MSTKTLITPPDGTPKQIVFANHAGDFSPTAANDLRVTTDGSFELDVEMVLAALADGAAVQSAKFDLGAKWAEMYRIRTCFEFAATPVAGNLVRLYLATTHHATAGTANLAGLSGTSGAYTGINANLEASLNLLGLPRFHHCTADLTGAVQVGDAGLFFPKSRYGILVAVNGSGAAFHSDDVESHIVLDPELPEFQA